MPLGASAFIYTYSVHAILDSETLLDVYMQKAIKKAN
jgi:hypothetical protein